MASQNEHSQISASAVSHWPGSSWKEVPTPRRHHAWGEWAAPLYFGNSPNVYGTQSWTHLHTGQSICLFFTCFYRGKHFFYKYTELFWSRDIRCWMIKASESGKWTPDWASAGGGVTFFFQVDEISRAPPTHEQGPCSWLSSPTSRTQRSSVFTSAE